jgi:GNAT superfamily N-acetyltransferase
MAAMTSRVGAVAATARVRAAIPGEGTAIAALWRELWDAHHAWGGYPGSREDSVYERLALRLDEDARIRAGRPTLGSHIHLVAELEGVPSGQVEGWLEQLGPSASAPVICEVRSLVVRGAARRFGLGRALLEVLAKTAQEAAPDARCVLAAEVLEPNPAHAFYESVGFVPIAWNAWLDPTASSQARQLVSASASDGVVAREAGPGDASIVARLESVLAARRRAAGDVRFEPPRVIDATMLTLVAAHLAADAREQGDSSTLVVVDRTGAVRGAASVAVQTLDPPFVPGRRALVGRFALDPAWPPGPLVAPLVALGCRIAESRGAARVELTDLSAPGTDLHNAVLATGARAWSRVVQWSSPVACPLQPRG